MSLFKSKSAKVESKEKIKSSRTEKDKKKDKKNKKSIIPLNAENHKKPKKVREMKTNKYRLTTEISLTGNEKNPFKSKMSGFFVKLSYKDGTPPKSNQNSVKALKDKKN